MARRNSILACASVLALTVIGSTGVARGAGTTADVNVTVNVQDSLGAIPSTAFGLNASSYDGNLLDASVPGLVRAAGVAVMRYPGGSQADVYHWQDNSITPGQGGYSDPSDTFDNFMGVVAASGAQAMITVNYGSNHDGTAGGDPQEAAGWVRYANMGGPGYTGPVPTYPGASPTGHTYGIKYWEIGNELYGNGTYGAHWETDLHPDAGQGPEAYGQHALEFITAMKAVDPSIHVGVVLTAPGNWPDEDVLGNAGTPQAWNDNVLQATCSGLDFVDVHWYPQDPGNESDANLLGSPENGIAGRTDSIPAMVARLRQEIATYCPSRASQIQIMITETNSVSYNPGKQTVSLVNALFADDSYMTWLENGVANVDWWQLHNGPVLGTNNSASLYGTATFGDYGVLANGQSPEPAADTPFPAYYGLQMLNDLGHAGDQMVRATSDNALVSVHAVKQANGNLAVLLINKDPNASHTVALSLPGYTPAPNPTVYTYGETSSAIGTTVAHGMPGTRTQTVGPYSLTTVVFTPKPHQT
jgi:hypothetical protein